MPLPSSTGFLSLFDLSPLLHKKVIKKHFRSSALRDNELPASTHTIKTKIEEVFQGKMAKSFAELKKMLTFVTAERVKPADVAQLARAADL